MNPHYRKPKPKAKNPSPTKRWLEAELKRQVKLEGDLGAAADVLAAEVPSELVWSVAFIRNKVLSIKTDSSANLYRLSNLMRGGLQQKVTVATDGRVQRVKVVIT